MPYSPSLRKGVAEAMRAWEEFCTLPDATKTRISYSGDLNVSGVGYELKLEHGVTNDLKEDFHLRLSERDFLEREADKVGPIALDFVEKALELGPLMEDIIRSFARACEKGLGMEGFEADTMEKMPRALIRFLHYFGNDDLDGQHFISPGDQIAMPHVDKGGFTLHLHESHPGLQRMTCDGAWVPMDFAADVTAIIPAMRMQYRSNNILKATCHRVVANEETARIGRYSAVCFMDFSTTPYYDKKRWGRLQDQPPGFNYTKPFEELKKMFEPA